MNDNIEYVIKVDSKYIGDDCVQIMTGFHDYQLFFGNNELMYYRNLYLYTDNDFDNVQLNTMKSMLNKNSYLDDHRKFSFPFYNVPEHIEKHGLFNKIYFSNQIIDFNMPYVRVCDRHILEVVALKDEKKAIIYNKVINHPQLVSKMIISKDELERYLLSGELYKTKEKENEFVCIFNLEGCICDIQYSPDVHIEKEKNYLLQHSLAPFPASYHYKSLAYAISLLDDIPSYNVVNDMFMIKFKNDGTIIIDKFRIDYVGGLKQYMLYKESISLTIDRLDKIQDRIDILPAKEPVIKRCLNHRF